MSQKNSTSTVKAAPAVVVASKVPVAMAVAEVEVEVDTETDVASTNDVVDDVDNGAAEEVTGPSTAVISTATSVASGVVVPKYAGNDVTDWLTEPKQNLVVVIHPWCKFRKSSADRQAEFPPPGFLDSLKAKLQMATVHRDSDEPLSDQNTATAVRKRHCNQKIKYWLQYTTAATTLPAGPSCIKKINAISAAAYEGGSPRAVDLITVWQRYAKMATASDKTNR